MEATMKSKPRLKVRTIKTDLELDALLPQLSQAHSGESFSGIVRKLIWQEIDRLGLRAKGDREKATSKRRHTT